MGSHFSKVFSGCGRHRARIKLGSGGMMGLLLQLTILWAEVPPVFLEAPEFREQSKNAAQCCLLHVATAF